MKDPDARMVRLFVRRGAIWFTVLGLVVYAFTRFPTLRLMLSPVREAAAWSLQLVLSEMGIDTYLRQSVLYHQSGFATNISHGCLGLLPAGLLVAGIMAFPTSRRARGMGLLLGVPLVLAVNFARLVHLYYLGVHDVQAFHFAHSYGWQVALVVVVTGMWFIWAATLGVRRLPSG